MPVFLIYIIPKNVRVTLKFFIFEKMKNTKKTSSTIQSIIQAVLNGEERVFCCGPNQGRPTLRMSNLRLPFTYFPFKSRHIIFVWRFCFILFRTNTFCGPNHKNTDWNDGYTSFHHSSCLWRGGFNLFYDCCYLLCVSSSQRFSRCLLDHNAVIYVHVAFVSWRGSCGRVLFSCWLSLWLLPFRWLATLRMVDLLAVFRLVNGWRIMSEF